MKFISYALATALSISTTSPVVQAATVGVSLDVGLDVDHIHEEDEEDEVDLRCKTIVQLAVEDERLETLVTALTAADLVDTLSSDGPFTVFAPLDTGFGALPEGTVADLLMPENKAKLTGLLLGHVVGGKVKSDDLVDGPVATLNGENVTVDVTYVPYIVRINDTSVIEADIEACNGVLHLIDAVLIPPPPKEPETSSPTDTLNSKSGKSTVAKASKAGSTSAKAGKSDTDKMKTTQSAKAEKASTLTTTTSAKAAKGADELDVPEKKPEEPKAEDESDKAEDEEEEKEEEEVLSVFEAAFEIFKIVFSDGHRKLSNHLRG